MPPWPALPVPSLHAALKTLAYRCSDDINEVAFSEKIRLYSLSNFISGNVIEPKFFHKTQRVYTGLLETPGFDLLDKPRLTLVKAYLYSGIAICLFGLYLDDITRPCFNKSYRQGPAVLIEYVSHAYLFT